MNWYKKAQASSLGGLRNPSESSQAEQMEVAFPCL